MPNKNKKMKTSFYISDRDRYRGLPISILKKAIWNEIVKILNDALIPVTFIDTMKLILCENLFIQFRINYLYDKILLTFFPLQKEEIWNKNKCSKAIETCLKICDEFSENIEVKIDNSVISFRRVEILSSNKISTKNWIVTELYKTPVERKELVEFLNNYSFINNLSKNQEFVLFTKTFLGKEKEKLSPLLDTLGYFGRVQIGGSIEFAREYVQKYIKNPNTIFVFCDKSEYLSSIYTKNKIYFDTQLIPTQFLRFSTIEKIVKFPGVRANLILEIFTKLGKKPIILRPSKTIIETDGTLCLSDIECNKQKLFGALFTYSSEGYEKEEEVHLYSDINFSSDHRSEYIEFSESTLKSLLKKISLLTGYKMSFDIITTKKWSYDNLKFFVDLLDQESLKVNKIYYISTKTSRFVDDSLLNGISNLENPYVFVNNKVAFLRTATQIRIYPTISQLYIELCWPPEYRLQILDLEKILWLTKKRMYRIQEFGVLKSPEPMVIFKNLDKMYLEKITGQLTIPLKLLI